MKRCNACDEEFANKFSFCPVDGTPLNSLAAVLVGQDPVDGKDFSALGDSSLPEKSNLDKRGEFNVTIIGGVGLARRLATEIRFLINRLQAAWPEFKRDPIGASTRAVVAIGSSLSNIFLAPNALAGSASAMLVVFSAVIALLLFGHGSANVSDEGIGIDQPVVQIINLRPPDPNIPPEETGVGDGSKGRVGLASGKGEGSEPEPRQSHGGGSGGDRNPLPQNQGAVPQPSEFSAPINPPLPNAALPLSGIDIDPALWKSAPAAVYGDPRSKMTDASKGPGEGGGIGTGAGEGIGEGHGDGFGPGDDGNIGGGEKSRGGRGPGKGHGNGPRDADRIFRSNDVSQRARVLSKPEAGYTEEARKQDITGTVVLRAIFSISGEVTGIQAVKSLPGGLTEKAIAAARQIRFVPAMKDGHPVSVYMQLEYNFNLY